MHLTQDQIQLTDSQNGHTYVVKLADREVLLPSVTTIINFVVNKPALVPWSYSIGVKAAYTYMASIDPADVGEYGYPSIESVKTALVEGEQTHDHVMKAAAARGIATHDALGAIASGNFADFKFEPAYGGFVRQLNQFVHDYEPEFHSIEYKVASLDYGYAGSLDTICTIHKHPSRRRHESLVGCKVLLDLKTNTNGAVYPESHLPQVEAYAHGYAEMGGDPIDAKVVVGVGPESYGVIVSYARFETFKRILDLYNELKWMKSNNPNGRK